MKRITNLVLVALAAGCAFDNGPARDVPVAAAPAAEAAFTTDLGWQVTLADARLYVSGVRFLDADDAWIGDLPTGHAVDLLAASQDLGTATFQPGSAATQAIVRVGPPESGAAAMHGAGLYLAGAAVPPEGGDEVSFTAALPIDADIAVGDLALEADALSGLHLEIRTAGWLDGIDFASLPDGAIAAGSDAAAALQDKLAGGALAVTTGD